MRQTKARCSALNAKKTDLDDYDTVVRSGRKTTLTDGTGRIAVLEGGTLWADDFTGHLTVYGQAIIGTVTSGLVEVHSGTATVDEVTRDGSLHVRGGTTQIRNVTGTGIIDVRGGITQIGVIAGNGIVEVHDGTLQIGEIADDGIVDLHGGTTQIRNVTGNGIVDVYDGTTRIHEVTRDGEPPLGNAKSPRTVTVRPIRPHKTDKQDRKEICVMTGSPPDRGTYTEALYPEEGESKPPTYQDVAVPSEGAGKPPTEKDPQIPTDEGNGSTPSTYQE